MLQKSEIKTNLAPVRFTRKLLHTERAWFVDAQECIAARMGDEFIPRIVGAITIANIYPDHLTYKERGNYTVGQLRRVVQNSLPRTAQESGTARVRWLSAIRNQSRTFLTVSLDSEVMSDEIYAAKEALRGIGYICQSDLTGPHISLGSILGKDATIPNGLAAEVRQILPESVELGPAVTVIRQQ